MDEAIPHFQHDYDLARSKFPALVPQMEEALAVAYLKRAEMVNGIYTTPGDRCLLSPRGLIAPLVKTDDAKVAVEHFTNYLSTKPDDIEVKWLLNIAYMMLGAYPNGVPEAYRIPPKAFASTEDVGRFVDIAPRLGLAMVRTAGGIVIDDFDNDGRVDVVIVRGWMSVRAAALFRQQRAMDLHRERTAAAGLLGSSAALNLDAGRLQQRRLHGICC